MNIKLEPIINRTVYLWVFLFSINLFGYSTEITVVGGLGLILLYSILGKKIGKRISIPIILILFFGISYVIYKSGTEEYNLPSNIRELLVPVISFFVGYLSISETRDQIEFFKKIIFSISLGLFIYAALNMIMHISIYGNINVKYRMVSDIWHKQLIQATAQGTKLLLITLLSIPIIFKDSIYGNSKLMISMATLISFIGSIFMANRSIFYIYFITLMLTLIFYIQINKKEYRKVSRVILIILTMLILMIFLYKNNVFNIRQIIETSNLMERLTTTTISSSQGDPRIIAWVDTLKGLYYHPLGGEAINLKISSPHNLWLDIAYTSGIIPFFLIILISISFGVNFIYLMRTDNMANDFKLFLFSLVIGLHLNLMIEPILSGHYYLFTVYMILYGLIFSLKNEVLQGRSLIDDR